MAVQIPELRLRAEFVEAATQRGDVAFGAFDSTKLVSLLWRSTTSAPHVHGLSVRVVRPYIYAYKSFTLPKHRGQRLSPALILYSDTKFLKLGYTHRAGFVDICNLASLAAGKYAGSQRVGYAGYAIWFGSAIPFRSPAVRKIGFEFIPSSGS